MAMLLRAVVALSLLGAAAMIHAAQTPSHVEEWWAAGIVFVTLAVVQAALGVAALAVTDRRLYATAVAVSLATITLVGRVADHRLADRRGRRAFAARTPVRARLSSPCLCWPSPDRLTSRREEGN